MVINFLLQAIVGGALLVALYHIAVYLKDFWGRLTKVPSIENRFTTHDLAKVLTPREVKFVEFVLKRSNDFDWWYVDRRGQVYQYRFHQAPSLRAELITVFQYRADT